jgi:hypothetical protein
MSKAVSIAGAKEERGMGTGGKTPAIEIEDELGL